MVRQREQRLGEPALDRAEPGHRGVDLRLEGLEHEGLVRGLDRRLQLGRLLLAREPGRVIDIGDRVAGHGRLLVGRRLIELRLDRRHRDAQPVRGRGDLELGESARRLRTCLGLAPADRLALGGQLEPTRRAEHHDV